MMLGLGNLSRGNQTNETVQQISKSSDPDLEEIYAALAKQTEGMDVGSPSSPNTYSAKEEDTYEGMRKVLGGNGNSGASSEVDPVTKFVFDFFTEDIRTMLDPEATAVEKAMAFGFTFFKPAKLLDKAADVAGAARDAGKAVDDVKDTGKAVDKTKGIEKGKNIKDYKKTFFNEYPDLKGSVVVHHAIEQQISKRHPNLFTLEEIHALENLRGIPKEINSDIHLSKIRRDWNRFYRNNPNPTKEEVISYMIELDKKYGENFNPPVKR
ncbi:hypothetical protein [Lysinibacillus odysseyi]|uniref:hypothetical protein n=1 Tax=Lysinibacillus odysseyi TaxID=202611 RepID=UPI00117D24FD|nr:hypothetical protein [Lysinibacillus odysseyi]